ncbi:MAG: J domain-containing protein [Verrucomicrobiota bacterium]
MPSSNRVQSPYFTLGVTRRASEDEIRKAYRQKVKLYHPDRYDPMTQPLSYVRANERMSKVNEAYAILNDDEKRREYDEQWLKTKSEKPYFHPHAQSSWGHEKFFPSLGLREYIVFLGILYLSVCSYTILTTEGFYGWSLLLPPFLFFVLSLGLKPKQRVRVAA